MSKIKTAFEFAKNITTVGAFKQSSPKVEHEITMKLDPTKDIVVVEYGTGHGNITQAILDRISANSRLYTFEINEKFCEHVAEKIKDDRLHIINDSAENVKKHISFTVDNFIASLPFTFFSNKVGRKIIDDSYELLRSSSYFSQYFYVKLNINRFNKIFDRYELKSIKNIPTEYVFHGWKR
jgi:phospholipid N-methyltransferase